MATTRNKPAKLPKLPYPNTPTDDTNYWLAAWFRNQSKREAVDALCNKLFSKASTPLIYGLIRSVDYLKNDANSALSSAVKEGSLLFAWHGTTVFTTEVAA